MAPDAAIDTGASDRSSSLEQIDIRDFGRALLRRFWLVVWIALAVVLMGATIVLSIIPSYIASAYVEINPRQTRIVNFEAVLSGLPADTATMQTEIEIIRSRKLAERVVDKLKLENVPEFNSSLRAPSVIKRLLIGAIDFFGLSEKVDKALESEINPGTAESNESSGSLLSMPTELLDKAVSRISAPREIKQKDLASVANQRKEAIIDAFVRRLTVRPQGKSRVIGIFFRSEDPDLAASAANTIADFYIVAQLEAKFEAAKRANAWLSDRITKLREEVKKAERAVEAFRARSGLIQGGTQATLTGEQVTGLNTRFIAERTRLAEAQARLRQAESLLRSPRGIETAGEVLNSQTIRDLRRQEAEIERQVAQLSNEYGDKHPRMIAARAQKTDVTRKIKSEINKIIQSLRNEVDVARARTVAVRGSLEGLKTDIARQNASEVQLRALTREADASRKLLEQLLSRSKETASQTNFQEPDATVITSATVPDQPTYPKTKLLLVLLLVFGSGIGIAVAIIVDRVDNGFRSADEITRILKIPSLGLVPSISKIRTRGKDLQTYCIENPTSAYSEALRTLHTNLLLTDVGNRPKVVLVTSALPNEGKTSTVASLARLLAYVGQQVVVVDCDLRRPSVHKAFGVKEGVGLSDCVNDGASLEDAIQEDTLTSVHFLRAGAQPQNSPDLFDSVGFQQLLKTLSRNYDLVLLDSAPLMAVSDTLFLGRLADKTVLVVRWVTTRRATVELALKKLVDARAQVAGVLLSMVDVKGHASYGYSDSGTYSGALKRYYGS